MTIREFIAHLQVMDQDALVVRSRYEGNGYYRYEGFDGWWPRFDLLVSNGYDNDTYREASEGQEGSRDALVL